MTPLIDTVKTIENSIAGREDDELDGNIDGSVCDQNSLHEGLADSKGNEPLEQKKHIENETIKVTPIKACINKITSKKRSTFKDLDQNEDAARHSNSKPSEPRSHSTIRSRLNNIIRQNSRMRDVNGQVASNNLPKYGAQNILMKQSSQTSVENSAVKVNENGERNDSRGTSPALFRRQQHAEQRNNDDNNLERQSHINGLNLNGSQDSLESPVLNKKKLQHQIEKKFNRKEEGNYDGNNANYYCNLELSHEQQSLEQAPSSRQIVPHSIMPFNNTNQPILKVKAKDIKFSMKYKDKGSCDYQALTQSSRHNHSQDQSIETFSRKATPFQRHSDIQNSRQCSNYISEMSQERYITGQSAVGNNTITMDDKMVAPFYFTASNNNPVSQMAQEKYDQGKDISTESNNDSQNHKINQEMPISVIQRQKQALTKSIIDQNPLTVDQLISNQNDSQQVPSLRNKLDKSAIRFHMTKDRNAFRKKYSVQQAKVYLAAPDGMSTQKFDYKIDSMRDNKSLNSNDQIKSHNMNKIPSFHSTSPFIKDREGSDNMHLNLRNHNQFHSLTDATPTAELAKKSRDSYQRAGLIESSSMISSSKMNTMKAELSSIDKTEGFGDLTPNKKKDFYQDDSSTYNLMNMTVKNNQRTLQQTISPLHTNLKPVSSRMHSLYEQANYESNRVRIIDQQIGEVGQNFMSPNENASYTIDPQKLRSTSHNVDPLSQEKSSSGLKNLRKMNRAAILEEIEKNKIEEIRTNLTNNKHFRKPKPFQSAANYSSKNSQPDEINLKNLQKVINSSIVNHSSSTAAEESLNLKLAKGQRERNLNGISRIGGLAQFAIDNQVSNTSSSIMQSSQISQSHLNKEISEIDKNLCDINLASHDMMQDKIIKAKNSLVTAQSKYSPFNYGGVFDSQNNSSVNFKSKQWRGANISQRESQTQVIVQSQNSLDLSPSFQYSRAALMQLKENSHSPHKNKDQGILDNDMSLIKNTQQSLEAPITSQEINIDENSPLKKCENVAGDMQDQQNLQQQLFRQQLNKSRQLMAVNRKLSSVLEASPLKNSYIGRIFHDRYQNHLQQPDGSLTLASILNETLSKLKGRGPNKAILKPIKTGQNPFQKSDGDSLSPLPATGHRYNNVPLKDSLDPSYQLNILHQKGSFTGSDGRAKSNPRGVIEKESANISQMRGINESQEESQIVEEETNIDEGGNPAITIRDVDESTGGNNLRRPKPSDLQMSSALNVLEGVMENEQQHNQQNQQSVEKRNDVMDHFMEDLDLDELTQEDKFFLIQQIEDLNKNIRYCQNASPYIFEEDDGQARPTISQSPEIATQSSPFTKSHQKSNKDDNSGKQSVFGREKFHRHGARGVRGAKKLDIILDEEEDNDQDAHAASGDDDESDNGNDQFENQIESGVNQPREKGSFFYKSKGTRPNQTSKLRQTNRSPIGSDGLIENNNSDDMSADKKIVDSPEAVSFKQKEIEDKNDKNRSNLHCHKQSYMLESFDGGQTLRHNNQDDELVEDLAYRADKPVSINSSIEIISKKKSQRELANITSHRSPFENISSDKNKKKSKFMTTRQNLNLNQITSLSQLKRIKVHVEELEEDQSQQVQNKFKSRKHSMALRRNQDDLEDEHNTNQIIQNDEEVRNISSACSSAQS